MAATLIGQLRECRLALPVDTWDVYLRHQQVWQALSQQVRHGPDFLYRMLSPRIALVRSAKLSRGQPVELGQGPWVIDVVAARIEDRNTERPVAVAEIPQWASDRLFQPHGFQIGRIDVLHHWIAMGHKPARPGQPGHSIQYSAARLEVHAKITDRSLSQRAWALGIGRGRRFGFGMLQALR